MSSYFGLGTLAWVFCPGLALSQGHVVWQSPPVAGTNYSFGIDVDAAGDLNGDGFEDIVVAALPQTFVFSGADGSPLPLLAAAGRAVAGIGDVDGDGHDDVAVGYSAGGNGGTVHVFSGSDATILFLVTATTGADRFGTDVAGAGDVNADGTPDWIVGAPQITSLFMPLPGYAKVYSGADASVLHMFVGVAGPAPIFGDQFGTAVAGVGDVDGDAVPDVAVGAPEADPSGLLGAGRVKVFSGATGVELLSLHGIMSGDHLGWAVAGPGDVDGDGLADVLVGGLGNYARLFSGATGAAVFTFTGLASGDRFGKAVSGAGDVDRDGVPDLAIGAPQDPTVTAAGKGYIRVFSGADGALRYFAEGTAADSRFGFSLAAVGDVNGDGFDDLLVGAPGIEVPSPSQTGYARVVTYVGVPPGSFPFGAGCPGSGGIVPLLRTAGGWPTANTGNPNLRFALSKAWGGTFAVLVLGVSSQSWLGSRLPLDLGFLGLSGCSLHVSADSFFPATTSGSGAGDGVAFVDTPVPALPVLSGQFHYFQWYVVDPGPLALPGALSHALALLYL